MTQADPIVKSFEAMDRTALCSIWEHLFKKPSPKGLSQPFLRRFIALEVQTREFGGLTKGFVKNLQRQVRQTASSRGPALAPGGRLLREWNGVTHVVEATGTGYRWNNTTYASLSAVARAITGAHWSGPRFFGLKDNTR